MTKGKENNISRLVSIRLRKDLLVRLEEKAGELDVPYQTVLQGLVGWGLDKWDEGNGPSDRELLAIMTRRVGRPKKDVDEGAAQLPPMPKGRGSAPKVAPVEEPDVPEDESPEATMAGLNLDIVGLK